MWTRELRRRKGRTVATGAAVAIATALLVSMLAISDGIIATVESQVRESQADILISAPYDINFEGGRAIAADLASWDEVDFATAALRTVVAVSAGARSASPVALGVEPGRFLAVLPEADRGLFDGWFAEPSDPHFALNYTGPWTDEVVLSRELADTLGVARGDGVEASRSAGEPGHLFRVVGIADLQLSADRIIQDVLVAFFHLSELQEVSGDAFGGAGAVADRVSRLYVALEPSARSREGAARAAASAIEEAYPDFAGMVATKQQRLDRLQAEYEVGRVFYTAIGLVAILIGLLFVGCIVAISVSERTRDIGALRAMGISKRSIFLMVLGESCLVVVVGAGAGILPAYFAAEALGAHVAASQGVAPTLISFSAPLVAAAVFEVVASGALMSLYPAWRATRIPVVEALAARA
jgi:putative ABC transport system permease protein